MKKINTLAVSVVGAAMTFAGVSYAASNWVRIDEGSPSQQPKCHARADVDTNSWTASGSVVRAWGRDTYGPSHAVCPKEDYREFDLLSDWDCEAKMTRWVSARVVDWNGKVESGDNDGTYSWQHVVPDTRGAATLDFVCAALAKSKGSGENR